MKYGIAKQFPLDEEYRKPTEVKPKDIARLREWMKTQPHLPEKYITDLDLILAYYCCANSLEVAKQVLDLNLTLKTMFTSLFKDVRFEDKIDSTMRTVLMHHLPSNSRDGCPSYYARLLDLNPKKFIFVDIMRTALMLLELVQYEEGTLPGIVVIIDLEDTTLAHLAKLDLQTVQQLLYYIQEALLINLKSVHFVNAPFFMNKLMMILKPFLKKELMESIHIHDVGSQTLDEFFPMEALPKSEDLIQYRDFMIEKMSMNSEFFEATNKKRVVESLRPGKPKTVSDIFGGIVGSFKKLDID